MSALDSVLADLVESDRDCDYVTVRREPLEALIDEWLARGDQISLLCMLVTGAQKELAAAWNASAPASIGSNRQAQELRLRQLNCTTSRQATTIAHHRHAIRKDLAARLKQVLRSAIADIHQHVTEALLKGQSELAERLESERQTVQIVIGAIDAIVSRLVAQELTQVEEAGGKNAAPSA